MSRAQARIPFLRHVCRSCAATWVPGICGDCAHTSVTFTVDGLLSPFARCGCGGGLRQVVYAPDATCSATAHVDLYGLMVCGTISAPSGSDVHYDTQVGSIPFDQPVTVSSWREQ